MNINGRQFGFGSIFTLFAVICFALALFGAKGFLGLDFTILGFFFFALGHLI